MLGMLSSVVAAAGRSSGLAPDCPVYRPVQAYGRFVVGRDLHRECPNGNAVRRPGTASDARTAVRTARAMSNTAGSLHPRLGWPIRAWSIGRLRIPINSVIS